MRIVVDTNVLISAASRWVNVPHDIAELAYSPDADDDQFIHAAIAAKAELLITGDQDSMVLIKKMQGNHQFLVCKPAEDLVLLFCNFLNAIKNIAEYARAY